MRRFLLTVVAAAAVAAVPVVAQNVAGPAKAKATTPEIPFESVPNFFKMPAGIYMGEGVGVATNSKAQPSAYSPRMWPRAKKPMCAYMQSTVPTSGFRCVDQWNPGGYAKRLMRPLAAWTTSTGR